MVCLSTALPSDAGPEVSLSVPKVASDVRPRLEDELVSLGGAALAWLSIECPALYFEKAVFPANR